MVAGLSIGIQRNPAFSAQFGPMQEGRTGGEEPAAGLARRRAPPHLSREICRVVGGDI